jgi:hypothetical protein
MQNGLLMDAPASTIRVKVGADEYEPRWSFLAEYLLSTRDLTLQEVLEEVRMRGKKTVSFAMELLSACIAHHFPSGAVPDAASLAAKVAPGQFVPIWVGLMACGRAAGAIVDPAKNEQPPAAAPVETIPQA